MHSCTFLETTHLDEVVFECDVQLHAHVLRQVHKEILVGGVQVHKVERVSQSKSGNVWI
jgi:hypothetical protein